MLSLCTEYYQFFLAYGIVLGMTASMMYPITPEKV
jgi:hypothetical protein